MNVIVRACIHTHTMRSEHSLALAPAHRKCTQKKERAQTVYVCSWACEKSSLSYQMCIAHARDLEAISPSHFNVCQVRGIRLCACTFGVELVVSGHVDVSPRVTVSFSLRLFHWIWEKKTEGWLECGMGRQWRGNSRGEKRDKKLP